MKKPSYADLAIEPLQADLDAPTSMRYQDSSAPPELVSPPSAGENRRAPSSGLAQFILRMSWEKRRRIHQLALELGTSGQALFMEALDEYLKRRGLRLLD